MSKYHLRRYNRAAEKIVPVEIKSFDTWDAMSDYVSANYLVSKMRANWPKTGRIEMYANETLEQVAYNK